MLILLESIDVNTNEATLPINPSTCLEEGHTTGDQIDLIPYIIEKEEVSANL